MLDEKKPLKSFILVAIIWHCLCWTLASPIGPGSSPYGLFDQGMMFVHTVQVFGMMMIQAGVSGFLE